RLLERGQTAGSDLRSRAGAAGRTARVRPGRPVADVGGHRRRLGELQDARTANDDLEGKLSRMSSTATKPKPNAGVATEPGAEAVAVRQDERRGARLLRALSFRN